MRKVNLTNKLIAEFEKGDTIYIRKLINNFTFFYFCEFVSCLRGVVKAKVISCEQQHREIDAGKELTAKLSRCFLWGKDENDEKWERCHWFTTKERSAK